MHDPPSPPVLNNFYFENIFMRSIDLLKNLNIKPRKPWKKENEKINGAFGAWTAVFSEETTSRRRPVNYETVMISVERHGEKGGFEFWSSREDDESRFSTNFFCRAFFWETEISFSFSPTIVTRTRDMPVPRSHEDMLVHRILHFSRSTSQSQRRSEKSRFTEFTLLLVIKGTGLS